MSDHSGNSMFHKKKDDIRSWSYDYPGATPEECFPVYKLLAVINKLGLAKFETLLRCFSRGEVARLIISKMDDLI